MLLQKGLVQLHYASSVEGMVTMPFFFHFCIKVKKGYTFVSKNQRKLRAKMRSNFEKKVYQSLLVRHLLVIPKAREQKDW